uniref:quinolinate synthase n=1 Tax=Chaetoceros debilis TaxID=122233 RepID=A0A7S3VE79_9STRA
MFASAIRNSRLGIRRLTTKPVQNRLYQHLAPTAGAAACAGPSSSPLAARLEARSASAARLSSPSIIQSRFMSSPSAAYSQTVDVFPSIVIEAGGNISAQGPFAEAQAQFLEPDMEAVHSLNESLTKANMGVVAHYYMDVELQGILTSLKIEQLKTSDSSRIAIADSLKMGDDAVKMCEEGATSIACLGVDFMSESVATIMSRNGYAHIPVYRATARHIGCSLAESAEKDAYQAWLQKGRAENKNALHVVYINTSLETKAVSNSIVPTITCTSSNVMATILQASSEVPDVKIMYGPDTYMGENLVTMFTSILNANWDDDKIAKALHPKHNRATLEKLRDNIDVYPNGNCVVHHMFGNEVVNTVKNNYDDAFVTAHLEVPGEMFQIAMEKSLVDKGVVGSTSDILKFISGKVSLAVEEEAASASAGATPSGDNRRLKFILGTEAGMVTSIVKSVQDILAAAGSKTIETEIVFPVSSEAVMGVDDDDLAVVPGVAGGEGCSTAGGCATCPFMKMNDVDALSDIAEMVIENSDEKKMKSHLPPQRLIGKKIDGIDAVDLGSEPILWMRHFMKESAMPKSLIQKISS